MDLTDGHQPGAGRVFHGAALRSLRQQAGIRQTTLARAADCSVNHLFRAETGRRHYVSVELMYRLATALTQLSGRPVTIDDFSSVRQAA